MMFLTTYCMALWSHLWHCLEICTMGPAIIRTVCKYSRKILVAGIIFAL